MASVQTPRNDVLPPLVEAADAILKIAEIRARTIPASDVDIITHDIEGDAVGHLADLIATGASFAEAQQRAANAMNEAEAGFHILLAKRAADAWIWAQTEMDALLRRGGLA